MATAFVTARSDLVRRSRRRPGFAAMLSTEWTLFRREPVGLAWGLLVPVVAVIVIGLIPGTRTPLSYYGGQSVLAHYQPILVTVCLAMLALNALPPVLATYRERGVLRRLSLTPVPRSRILVVLGMIHAGVAAVSTALILFVTRAYGVALPGQPLAWIVAFLLTLAAVLALGTLVSALSPTSKIANGVGGALFFPLMFLAGLWVPTSTFPAPLRVIADYSPLGASVHAMTQAADGHFPGAGATVALVVYAVLLPVLAVRFFRWE